MKVTFATYDLDNDVGGVSSWLRRSIPRLISAGIDVDVNVLAIGGAPGVNCEWFEKHNIPFRWKRWDEDIKMAVRDCLTLIEESQPDVYVPNCILPAYYAAGYVHRQNVHTVGVLHSDDPFYWGVLDEFVNGPEVFRLSAVVAVSKFLEKALTESAGNRDVITRRIAYGIPIPVEFAKPPNDVLKLVYFGRLVEEQKCISEVTRALCAVVKQNSRVDAWIIGEGIERDNVERIISESGLDSQRIRLVGRVDVSQIYSMLKDCNAFVLLSDYEGLPISMLEAMAVGVVPICLDMRSGIREVIQPGINGMIVKDRYEDFYASVRRLLKDPVLWTKLSTNARATVREQFSEDVCAAAWVELLQSFEISERVDPIKSPAYFRLPRRNPKFGHFDHRHPRFSKSLSRLRITLGHYRRKVLESFQTVR